MGDIMFFRISPVIKCLEIIGVGCKWEDNTKTDLTSEECKRLEWTEFYEVIV